MSSPAVGESVRALLLEPTGKTVAWLRVTRLAGADVPYGETADAEPAGTEPRGEAYLLDTDAGIGPAMTARLERFKLRTKCDFRPLAWQCVAIRGDGASVDRFAGAAEVVAGAPWPGIDGVDLWGPTVDVPDGATAADADRYEQLRVDAGVPVTGVDLAVDGIPNEGGRWLVDQSVSFTKGCYTGQELVARIDSRGGHVPRPIRLLDLASGDVAPGASVADADGKVVGEVTSVAGEHALGVVGRAVEPGSAVTVEGSSGPVAATVRSLPV